VVKTLFEDVYKSVRISIYPNPTTDELFLEDHNDSRILKDVNCVDLLGNSKRQEFHITATGKYKLSTSELLTGVYIYILRFDDLSQIVKRIIVE
jgi:hypothetical protein